MEREAKCRVEEKTAKVRKRGEEGGCTASERREVSKAGAANFSPSGYEGGEEGEPRDGGPRRRSDTNEQSCKKGGRASELRYWPWVRLVRLVRLV